MPAVILASSSYDHTIRFWAAPSGACYRTIQYADSQINKLEITPDKRYLAAAGNPTVRLFEVGTNNPNPVTSFAGHTNNITAVGFERDGRWMYTGSEDKTLKLWDLRAPGAQREYECAAPVNTVALHPNQAELLSGDQAGNVRVWDLTANACSRELVPAGEIAIRSVSIAPDGGKVVAANNRGDCFVWRILDSGEFEAVHKIRAHNTYVLKCLISPDSQKLATTSADHTAQIWDMNDYRLQRTLAGHQRWVWDCAFSADSDFIVTASSDNVMRLWDVAKGETIRHYTGHHKAVTCCALNDSSHTSVNQQ